MGVREKIKEIEDEIKRTQKNKATNFHIGLLRGKLSRLRTQLIEGGGPKGQSNNEGFDVVKSGDARVALIGFPSVGKSTLMSKLTSTESLSAAYEFTTLTCIPGVLRYKDARIQLLDLPGIIESAATGKGRGRQVIGVARNSDLILMVVEAENGFQQIKLLRKELETAGIRMEKRPDVVIKKTKTGGIHISSVCSETLDPGLVKAIMGDYKIHNAQVLIREKITIEQFIDVLEGNRKYIKCLYVFNKIDNITIGGVNQLAQRKDSIVTSAHLNINLNRLISSIWDKLEFLRVYTKTKGKQPDLTEPIVLRKGSCVKDVCRAIHRNLQDNFRYALVWGKSAKHRPQNVGINHILADEDVLQIVA